MMTEQLPATATNAVKAKQRSMLNLVKMGSRSLFVIALLAACGKEAPRAAQRGDAASDPPRQAARPDLSGAHYVGTRHGALPRGVIYIGGTVVRIGALDYAIAYVRTPDGPMLWLDSIVPGRARLPEKIVLAQLRIPPLERDERLFMASCDVNGRLDARVVAIVVDEPKASKFTKVRQAWRADPHRGRFDVIPVTGVTCEDPEGTPT